MPEWLPAVAATLAAGGFGSYIGVKIAISNHGLRISSIEAQIGDTDTGIRGRLHKHHNRLGRHAARLMRLEEKIGIPPWDDKE